MKLRKNSSSRTFLDSCKNKINSKNTTRKLVIQFRERPTDQDGFKWRHDLSLIQTYTSSCSENNKFIKRSEPSCSHFVQATAAGSAGIKASVGSTHFACPTTQESSGLCIYKGKWHVAAASANYKTYIHTFSLSQKNVTWFHPQQTRLQMTPSRWGIEGEGLATSVFIASRRANSQAVRLDVLDLHSLGQR